MSFLTILLVVAGVATSHCLFLAASLFLLNAKLSNRILAVILLLLAVRTSKSIIALLFPETAYLVSVLGLVAMALLGPLLLFFTVGLFTNHIQLSRRDYLQLLPSAICLILFLTINWTWMTALYYLFTAHVLFYIVWTCLHLLINRELYQVDDLKWKWAWSVFTGISLIWVSFFVQVIFYDPITYTLNVVTAAAVVYALSLHAVMRSKLFMHEPRRKTESTRSYDELGSRIRSLLDHEEVFIDPNLNISKLAEHLKAPPYLVSKTINHFFKKSFSELVIGYRIKKSEQLLFSRNQVLSIEGIAYESGFNSLSAFYTAFKRINKMTPAQFRNRNSNSTMQIA